MSSSRTRYAVVFLDLDGTVLDFDRAQGIAFRETLILHGMPHDADVTASYKRINREVWTSFERGEITQQALRSERFRLLLTELGRDGDAHRLGTDYLSFLGQQGCLLNGALRAVEAMARCATVVAVTNGIPEVQHSRIERSGLAPFLASRVISGEVGAAKPSRAIFDVAMRSAGGPDPARVLMVGDSLQSDIRGAVDYGIDSCWFDPAGRGRRVEDPSSEATHVVTDLDAIVALVT